MRYHSVRGLQGYPLEEAAATSVAEELSMKEYEAKMQQRADAEVGTKSTDCLWDTRVVDNPAPCLKMRLGRWVVAKPGNLAARLSRCCLLFRDLEGQVSYCVGQRLKWQLPLTSTQVKIRAIHQVGWLLKSVRDALHGRHHEGSEFFEMQTLHD